VILLTVGTQRPFDRFVQIVDEFAPALPVPVFAQTGRGRYRPRNMEWQPFIGPIEFESVLRRCSLITSHAGIGTVVMAQKHRRPVILFPRRAALGEHVNDHQLATVEALRSRRGMHIAMTEEELRGLMLRDLEPPFLEEDTPSRALLRDTVTTFLGGGDPGRSDVAPRRGG
jgi:UDP-N-acetylglucosamine transferase subunit ALG13